MEVTVIGFLPPVAGVEKDFSTIRIGSALFKRLKKGDKVFLMDEKRKVVFGRAKVLSLDHGSLAEMCVIHGHTNHTELSKCDPCGSPARLYALTRKIYGPRIANPLKRATVIYLRRIE